METEQTTIQATAKEDRKPNVYFEVDWIRFAHHPAANVNAALKKNKVFILYGGTGEGKSNLAEILANNYDTIFDIFGAQDCEGLAWLRSSRKDGVLLLHGDTVDVKCQHETMSISEFLKHPIEYFGKYKVVLSVAKLYSSIEEEYRAVISIIEKLRTRRKKTQRWCVLMRELANLIYARLSISRAQQEAKNYLITVIRELRHYGFSIVGDSIRLNSIDIDLRSVTDYSIVKGQGLEGLPNHLHWVYTMFDPYDVMQMSPEAFIILSRKGPVGCGSACLAYWHADEKEDLLEIFHIEYSYKREINYGQTPNQMGDIGHAKIIRVRYEHQLSYEAIADHLHTSSRTPFKHVKKHNSAIEFLGECEICSKVNSPYSKIIIP